MKFAIIIYSKKNKNNVYIVNSSNAKIKIKFVFEKYRRLLLKTFTYDLFIAINFTISYLQTDIASYVEGTTSTIKIPNCQLNINI